MTRALLTTCGRNIFPAPNRSPTTFIPSMSGPSMTSIGRVGDLAGRFGVLDDPGVDALDEGVRQPRVHGQLAPGERVARGPRGTGPLGGVPVGDREQPFGGIRPPVEDDVLGELAQARVDVVVDGQRPGVDDAHVHARGDGVVQEDGVDRLADRVVAPERERDVGDAARHERTRERRLDPPRRLDVGDGVARVLLDPGADREDVRVEDDVLGLEPDDVDEQPVGAGRDRQLALGRVGLAGLVEGHDDDGRTVAPAQPGVLEERLLALLERDRVHDRPCPGCT